VLFVHGPGGIGQTTLLLEMRARATAAGRTTVLLDGYEQLGAIDSWMRQDFVPSLPAEDVVVLAGVAVPDRRRLLHPGHQREPVARHAASRVGRPRA